MLEFDELQKELETDIDEQRREAREKLLNNFDREVVEMVRVSSTDYLDRFEDWLWEVFALANSINHVAAGDIPGRSPLPA